MQGGINQYAYANNSPVMFTDPWGLKAPEPGGVSSTYWGMVAANDGVAGLFPQGAPIVTIGQTFGALTALGVGLATGNQSLVNVANQGLDENRQNNVDALLLLGTMGRSGAKSGVPGKDFTPSENVTGPYVRPIGTTAAQKASVQGQPCVDCGAIAPKQVADHTDPLVVQYYREGAVNIGQQSSVGAVQPHCPTCSASQGGQLGAFGKSMLKFFGF